jgi:GNAT superfamily N-acetyltransferase
MEVIEMIILDTFTKNGYTVSHGCIFGPDGESMELRINDKNIHIAFMYVQEGTRRRGLGSKMIRILTEAADRHGYTINLRIQATSGVGKDGLTRFYRRFGFVKLGGSYFIRRPKKPSR